MGYDLIAVGRNQDRLRQLAETLTAVTVTAVAADLSSDEGIRTVAELCVSEPLDRLVNNARVRNSPLVTRQPDESRWSAERTAALSQAPATGALKDWLPVLSSARARRRREPPTGGV
jgi:NAD(P)-dependent dehydrogenase (short-subunit alcohol dehydrogenase family)